MTKPNEFPKNITDSYYSQQFELVNEELRRHFRLANNEIEQVKEKVNELVQTVHDEHNNWSLNKIAQYIYIVNQDLDGFSKQTVYNKITDENRVLLLGVVVTKPTLFENRRKLQNKAPESLVTLLKVYYPYKEMMLVNKVRFFLYFVIMVRNTQSFSPWLFIEMMVR